MPESEMPARLADYLGRIFGGAVTVRSLERVEGGWSRATSKAVVDVPPRGPVALALRGELPVSVLDTPLAREYAILRSLAGTGVPVPAVHAFEPSGDVLGNPFLVTDWVDGACVNVWRRGAADELGTAARRAELASAWIADIVRLHRAPVAPLQALGIDVAVDAETYLCAEVDHWAGALRAATRHPGPLVEEICAWLAGCRPAATGPASIVHGDLRLGNMIVAEHRVAAFLDWEMSGVGDWRADIGYCLMPYNAGKLLGPVPPSANLLVHPRAFLDAYFEASGRAMADEELRWFIVLACTKMLAIFCAGIDAVAAGGTTDPRLAWTSIGVPGLVDDACQLIERGLPW